MARNYVWTTKTFAINLVDVTNKAVDLSANLLTGLGVAHLAGFTIIRTIVTGFIQADSDNTTFEAAIHAHWGCGIFAGAIDDGDFPGLGVYDGDYYAYGALVYQNPGVASNVVVPPEAALIRGDSRAMRKIDRVGEVPKIVFAQNTANDFIYNGSVSTLLMMP